MLNIKNEEVCRLVKDLADKTGESMTAAVHIAVKERLDRLKLDKKTGRLERALALSADTRQYWKEPYLSTDHGDLLYDENGLPK